MVQVCPLQAATVKVSLPGVTVATVPTTAGFTMIVTLVALTVSVAVVVPYTTTSSPTATLAKVGEVTLLSV
jgi:hypothetical protein